MTTREKIAHLYRRFAFGATPAQLDAAQAKGVEATLNSLIDAPALDTASPYEFYWREKEEADLGAYRTRAWWLYQLITNPHPTRDKLAIFWHSHFAVSDGKVEDGPMMLDYLQTIRQNSLGKFPKLLEAVSKNPAMMKYLDMDRAVRGRPNENFAREVMELFTLGIGNYTEKDVQEVARALTGWGYLNTFYEWPGDSSKKLKDAISDKRSFAFFTSMPSARDDGEKTILGKTSDFDGDEVLKLLAEHPVTARRICHKLWEYIAYPDPEEKVVNRLADVYRRTQGDVRALLLAIGRSDEFWSTKCIRQRVKDPADFVIGIARAMGIGPELEVFRDPKATPQTRIPNDIFDQLWWPMDRMEKAGLNLLYPLDVSGWKWGTAWVSPDMMIERIRYHGLMIWGKDKAGKGSQNVLAFINSRPHATPQEVAQSFCELFDVALSADKRQILAEVIAKDNGMESLKNPVWFQGVFDRSMAVLVAAPEMHFC